MQKKNKKKHTKTYWNITSDEMYDTVYIYILIYVESSNSNLFCGFQRPRRAIDPTNDW